MTTTTILVIDDDEQNYSLLQAYNYNTPIALRHARTGRDGFRMIQRYQPRVVLIDLVIPGEWNGAKVIEAVRELPENEQPYLIAMTDADRGGAEVRAFRDSCDEVMHKPLPLQTWRALVAMLPSN